MIKRPFARVPGNAVILAAACLAMAIISTSCGGGAGIAANPVSTASFSLSPSTLTFGNQAVATTATTQTATVKNGGNAALTLASIQVTGPDASDYTVTNNCGSSLAPLSQCTLSIAFTPGATGARAAAVVFSDNAEGSPQSLNLSGTGVTDDVSLSATALTFGSQLQGTASPPQSVTLTNNGNESLSIASVAVTGANADDFTEASTCAGVVAPGASCTITVTFQPSAAGPLTADVTVSDKSSHNPHRVRMSGTGAAPAASLSPTSLAFASQSLRTTAGAQNVILTNSGNATLDVSRIVVSGANASDFAQINNCGSTVAPAANCTISVTFTPSAAGTRSAALTITDNAPGSPQSVSLTGTTAGSSASLSPTSLTFSAQAVGATSAAKAVTLTNSGNAALTISSLALSGANASNFAQSNNCGASLAAGANCTIRVTFTPPAAGTFTAALTLTDNATGSPQSVSLTGTTATSSASFSPTSLTFGSEPIGVTSSALVVTLSNTGSASLTISGINFTGASPADFTEVDTCIPSVAAGGNCTIAVLFSPSANGPRTASLSVSDNASGSPQSVSLSGSGSHDVILSWAGSTTAGVTGYNVYRGTSSGGESSTPLNPTPIASTTFTDATVTAGTTYYYVVTSVSSGDVTQSAASTEAAATIPSP